MGRAGRLDRRSVSPLVATVLLIVTTLLAGGVLVEGLGRLEAPTTPPQTVVQLWTNYPGYGGIAIVRAGGEGIGKAYRADIFEETPLGTLLENIRWLNVELRVNGVRMENQIDLALATGPVKRGVNDLPGPGEALALCFRGENLKVGDRVELIHVPTGYRIAEATVAEPSPGRAYVDTAIQLRAARMLGRQDNMVKAMKEKRFSEARRLAYELQAIARDIHDNYLARSKYLENNLWELNRYMPDLVSENLCKTLIVIYEGCLPHLINAMEAIDNIIYRCLYADDPSLLYERSKPNMSRAIENCKIINWNLSMAENLRWRSKYYTRYPGENENSPESKIRRMEILTALPGGFIQDLSRDLYLPFLTPWVDSISISISGLEAFLNLRLGVANLGTTRVENILVDMHMWLENSGDGEPIPSESNSWAARFFDKTTIADGSFYKIKVKDQFVSNPIIPMQNTTMTMWEHIVWNFGWPRLPYPTKCEGQYWWVDEHQLIERFSKWGLSYDLTENNHPIIEFFRKYYRLPTSAPYTGEGGRAWYFSASSITNWSFGNLNPGENRVLEDTRELGSDLSKDDKFSIANLFARGDDAFWKRKTELNAFAVCYIKPVC